MFSLHELGLQRDQVVRCALEVLHPNHYGAGHLAFQFDVPSGTVRSKVSASLRSVDEGKAGSCCLRNVDEVNWAPDDAAETIKRSDNLLGKIIEGIHSKRHRVIEDAGSAPEDRLLVFARRP